MLKSKFIDIIRTFSPSELRQFRDFVRSPYHNRNKNVIKVFEYIKKYLPDKENERALTKEKIFSKIYPRKKYNDLVLRILLSDLIKLSEEFLIIQRLKKQPHEEYQFLLQELNDREIDNLYGSISKEAFSLVRGYDDLRVKYLKLFEYEMNYIDHNLQRNKQQLITNNVLTRSEYLICFFIIELAGNIHDLIINENTFNAKFDFNLAYEFINRFDFNGLLKKLRESGSEHYTILLIYVNLIKSLLNENDDASYDEFKKSVFENYDKISRHEAYNLLNNLETCCLIRRKYNPGKYEEESYYVYALMLTKNNYSYYGEEMGLQRYKNILLNFINLGKFYEAEHFVKNYIEKVPVQIRENLHLYSLALLDFSRKNYFDALKMIQKIKYDYFTLKYDIKNLTLKIYYELKYYENAYSLIDSYRHFLLKNKTVSKFFRERYLNFISFTNALIRSSSDEKQFDADRIRIDLLKTQNVVSRDWLLEKINELGTKR